MNPYEQANKAYFDELKTLVTDKPKHYTIILAHQKKYLLEWINAQLPMLDDTFKLCAKCHWILNGLTTFPKCQHCGKNIMQKNAAANHPHKIFCSTACMIKSNYRKEKIRQTCIKKYGVENVFQQNDVKRKIKQTCMSKYGAENPSQADCVKRKKEQSFLSHYGVKNISQTQGYKNKFKKTCLTRFGVENPFQSDKIKEKIKETCFNKYGVRFYSQTTEFNEKYKKTCLEKYGVENVSQTDEYREKYKKTCLEKYGVENVSQTDEYREKYKKTCLEKYGVEHPSRCREVRLKAQRRYLYEGVRFDSAPEIAYYVWLKDAGADFEYQPGTAFRYEYGGKEHAYFPDFMVGGRFVEIKGGQFLGESGEWICPWDRSLDGLFEAKRLCVLENGVEILYPDDYAKYLEYADAKFGDGWAERFRTR